MPVMPSLKLAGVEEFFFHVGGEVGPAYDQEAQLRPKQTSTLRSSPPRHIK
jgi:hypothetical protein